MLMERRCFRHTKIVKHIQIPLCWLFGTLVVGSHRHVVALHQKTTIKVQRIEELLTRFLFDTNQSTLRT